MKFPSSLCYRDTSALKLWISFSDKFNWKSFHFTTRRKLQGKLTVNLLWIIFRAFLFLRRWWENVTMMVTWDVSWMGKKISSSFRFFFEISKRGKIKSEVDERQHDEEIREELSCCIIEVNPVKNFTSTTSFSSLSCDLTWQASRWKTFISQEKRKSLKFEKFFHVVELSSGWIFRP